MREVSVTAHPIRAGAEGAGVVIVSVTDLTPLRITQRRLEESESRLSLALASADVGTWHVDLNSGVVTSSPALAQIFDYPTSTASLFEVIADRVHPGDVERVRTKWFKALAEGQPYVDEYRVRRTDGSVRWVYSRGRAQVNDRNEGIAFSGVLADVTESKLAEIHLNLERQKMTAMFEESPAAIALWRGPDLVFEKVNPRFRALFGGRELENVRLADALPDLAGQPFLTALIEVFRTGRPAVGLEVPTTLGPKNERHFFDYTYVRINDPNQNPYGVFGHAVDVTDRVRAREQLERAKTAAETANEAKSNFLANISHEIRTPLGAILGFADLMRDAQLDEDGRQQYLNVILRNGHALTRIIDDLLDLAKVEAGQIAIEVIDVDLRELLSGVTDLFLEKTRAKGITLDTHVGDQVPKLIRSDPTRLRQILINVVGNAVKFTDVGGVRIEVGADVTPSHATVSILVKDTGVGLSTEQSERLFKPFAQADNSTTRRFGGTGLGLVLARRLANVLGGDVTVIASTPGAGSVFKFEFEVPPSGGGF